jgi:hypothetical protein
VFHFGEFSMARRICGFELALSGGEFVFICGARSLAAACGAVGA